MIVFDKYLIENDSNCYTVRQVKEDMKCEVLEKQLSKGRIGKDYSNFQDAKYYSNIKGCLKCIVEMEVKDSNLKELNDLIDLLDEINNKIDNLEITEEK